MSVIEATVYVILGLFLLGLFLGTLGSILAGAINFGWKYAPYLLIGVFVLWLLVK